MQKPPDDGGMARGVRVSRRRRAPSTPQLFSSWQAPRVSRLASREAILRRRDEVRLRVAAGDEGADDTRFVMRSGDDGGVDKLGVSSATGSCGAASVGGRSVSKGRRNTLAIR